MKSWNLGRYALYALSISSVAALLVGCRANPGIGIPTNSGSTTRMHSAANGKTFSYTGKPQVFKVPAGVYSITVVMRGASSAWQACQYSGGGYGGRGARVSAVIPVTPHQKLWVYVGGAGNGSSGGFNGGGNGGEVDRTTGGAGASDVRVAPGRRVDRILVAGGGGGEGPPSGNTSFSDWGCPGYGGGLVGGDGLDGLDYYGGGGGGGGGGSQSAGGTGGQGGAPSSPYHGNAGENGRLGIGGAGGQVGSYALGGGGGGGGGYYGGGGGGSGSNGSSYYGGGGGGGGGSSFAEPKATQVHFWKNWKNATGDGLVVFSW
jgi:hypothetical protein